MADRRLLVAGGVALLSLGLATTGLLVMASREPAPTPVASVEVPGTPEMDPAVEIDVQEAPAVDTEGDRTPALADEAAPVPAPTPEVVDSSPPPETAAAADPAEALPDARDATTPLAEAPADDGREEEPLVDTPDAAVPPPVGPTRLVVVATGIAWNAELAAAAAARLPLKVVFALPADLPQAAQRLSDWRATGREVLVRFAWQSTGDASDSVPLDAMRGVQAGRLEAQWARLSTASGGVVVEPDAARVLEPLAMGLADATGAIMLLGTEHTAPPPAARRVDPALLGEAGFTEVMHEIAHGTSDEPVRVLLLELYPALLEPVLEWLGELEAAGVELAGLDAVHGEEP